MQQKTVQFLAVLHLLHLQERAFTCRATASVSRPDACFELPVDDGT
eukprot:SAG11_NODE_25968_length_351_cov_1.027778_1_plen_45_part_01